MKLTTKKKLAREFLLLTLSLVLGVIVFLSIYPYNAFKRHQSDNLSTEITDKTKVADSLIKTYHLKCNKQKWFYDQFKEEYDLTDTSINTSDKWWRIFEKYKNMDTLLYRWNHKWDKEQINTIVKIGFELPKKLNEFIIKYSISDTDLINKNSAKKIYEENKRLKTDEVAARNKIVDSKEQLSIGIWALIISAFVLFVLRYLFYAIKWSIKTLRQKSE